MSGRAAQSQSLSLAELHKLCSNQNWEITSNALMRKGWKYYDSKKGDSFHYSTISLSYEKSIYNDKAQGWFQIYAYDDFVQKISYNFGSQNTFLKIRESLSANGYKKTDSDILNNEVRTTYANANFEITLASAQQERDEEYNNSHFEWYYVTLTRKRSVYDSKNGAKTDYWYGSSTIRAQYKGRNTPLSTGSNMARSGTMTSTATSRWWPTTTRAH